VSAQLGTGPVFLEWGSQRWLVSPRGCKRGGTWCEFSLRNQGIQVLVRDIDSSDSRPIMFVTMPSEPLMCLGYARCKSVVYELFRSLGMAEHHTLVSRVDIKCDVVGADAHEMTLRHLDDNRRFKVQRSIDSNFFQHHNRFTGFVVGSGARNGRMTVYDKMHEMRKHKSYRKIAAVEQYFGFVPEKLVRIEFSCRRDLLRDRFNVNSIEQMEGMTRSMAAWLSQVFYRQTEECKSRAHTHEAELSPVWRALVSAFETEWNELDLLEWCKRVGKPRPRHLEDQIIGCLTSWIAARANEYYALGSEEDVEGLFSALVYSRRTFAELLEDVQVKRLALGAQSPTGWVECVKPPG